jgi:hypothetical protein
MHIMTCDNIANDYMIFMNYELPELLIIKKIAADATWCIILNYHIC